MRPLYIAGPMTGYTNFNFEAFHEAAAYLRSMDLEVTNPAENFEGKQTLDWNTYLREAVKQVADSAGMVLLPGWEGSKGARLEHHVAMELGLDINRIEDFYSDDV